MVLDLEKSLNTPISAIDEGLLISCEMPAILIPPIMRLKIATLDDEESREKLEVFQTSVARGKKVFNLKDMIFFLHNDQQETQILELLKDLYQNVFLDRMHNPEQKMHSVGGEHRRVSNAPYDINDAAMSYSLWIMSQKFLAGDVIVGNH